MKPLSEQDHYEVLEVPPAVSAAELERAYQLVCATYSEDSLAGYSLFEPGDAGAVRERIDLAWRVLSDRDSRRAYDASLGVGSVAPAAEPLPPPAAAAPAPSFAAIEEFDEEGGEFDGARLRRSRLRQGLEIEDVARQTKVNLTYLRCIEEERFDELPARVYVRGFVMSFASSVGLDPNAVAVSYLQRFDHAHPQPRGRFSKGG